MTNYNNQKLEVRKQLAKAEDTAPNILSALSNDSDAKVRLLVASNPNTPVRVLQKLGEEFPDAITDNPIFNLLLLENPNTYFIKISLARSFTTSEETLTRLANARYYSEEPIVRAVANNPSTPIPVLEKLATWFPEIEENSELEDADRVHAGVASNPNTPTHVLKELAKHRSPYVREQVANNPNTPALILEELVKNRTQIRGYSNILLAVVNNPNTPLSTVKSSLEYLAGENSVKINQTVLNHPHVTDTAIKIVDFVEGKPGITRDLLKKLAIDKRRHIRYLVAEHPLTSAEILESLSQDKDDKIRYEIIKHPNTSSETLEKLTIWLLDKLNSRFDKSRNRISAPAYFLSEMKQIFRSVIHHPNINLEILQKIVPAKYQQIHLELLKSPLITSEVLDAIIDFYLNLQTRVYKQVLLQIGKDPDLSSKSLEKIYCYYKNSSKDELFRTYINFQYFISHLNCPAHILEELAYHKFVGTRFKVASNPNTPIHVLYQLAEDKKVAVKRSVMKNKNIPVELFNKLSDCLSEY